MAHSGEETGFGEICGLGAAAGQLAICLGLFELRDEFVFLGLKRERFKRGLMQPPGKKHEIKLRAACQNDQAEG
ncbi:MAG: hypothetical protein USCAAHI_03162 [Beijerinckiaceae bacterium]|nr:MAG: hypothetical protein USCAAHI_03162 [Beijerinckiaceae bacterium]